MPRELPSLDKHFSKQCLRAIKISRNIEFAKVLNGSKITIYDLEYAYEIAYLRVFVAWEVFLENVLFRLLAGYTISGNQEPLKEGKSYAKNIGAARTLIQGNRDFVLWHACGKNINRAAIKFNNSNFEQVLKSAEDDLDMFSAIRHRIAHEQDDARNNFNEATMALCGRRFRAARAGRFLRYINPNSVNGERFLETITTDLENIATQLCQ